MISELFNTVVSALTLPPVKADLMIAPALVAALPAVGGALASFFSGFFGSKRKANDEKKRAAENDAAARRAWDQKEQARVARLRSLMSAASARGINMGTIDPSLLMPRPYPGPNSTAGMSGPSLWSGLLGLAGDTAMGFAQAQGSRGIPGQAEAAARGPIVGIEDEILSGGPQKSILPPPTSGNMGGSGSGFNDYYDF